METKLRRLDVIGRIRDMLPPLGNIDFIRLLEFGFRGMELPFQVSVDYSTTHSISLRIYDGGDSITVLAPIREDGSLMLDDSRHKHGSEFPNVLICTDQGSVHLNRSEGGLFFYDETADFTNEGRTLSTSCKVSQYSHPENLEMECCNRPKTNSETAENNAEGSTELPYGEAWTINNEAERVVDRLLKLPD